MTFSIVSVVILSLSLGSRYTAMSVVEMLGNNDWFNIGYALLAFALIFAVYLLVIMSIIFCKSMRISVFYTKRAGGFLTFLLAVGMFYIISVSPLLLAPFGDVTNFYGFFTVTVGYLGMGMFALLLFIFSAVLFFLSSRLMENKINI